MLNVLNVKNYFHTEQSKLFMNTRITLTVIIFLTVSVAMIYDAIHLRGFIRNQAKKFTQDITFQHAASITKEFTTRMLSMHMIADSLAHTSHIADPLVLDTFLRHKTDFSVFDQLLFVTLEEASKDPAISFHQQQSQGDDQTNREEFISYDGINNIYFVKQLPETSPLSGFLIGMRGRNNLQELVQLKILRNETVSCIVSRDSTVVVAPTNRHLPKNKNLDDFVLFGDTRENNTALTSLKELIRKQEPNVQVLKTIKDQKSILVTYTPLGINNWGLVTFIPEELITVGSHGYIFRTILISIIAIGIFGIITITAYLSYKKSKRQMELIAFHDLTTGGLNNEGFRLRFQEIVSTARPNQHAIVLMNMKNFKLINEQFGKEKGDRLLRYIRETIESCLEASEFVARASADRFFICLNESHPATIEDRLRTMSAQINSFNKFIRVPYYLDFYCGVRIIDTTDQDPIHFQDHAKYTHDLAVKENVFCVFYKESFMEQLLRNQGLDRLFENSIHNGDFKLYLQPKIRLDTGRIGGAEALVRWAHPEKGLILPSDFIPLFEHNGKICQLDIYMFEEVCKVVSRWHREGRTLFPISINLSRQHYFRNPDFLDTFSQLAQKYRIPPGILDFELTESIFFNKEQIGLVKKSLEQMHQLGFLCSLDDFGVGFSSLGLLKEFDIDTIKFDRQLFLDISTTKARTILHSLMEMSEKLGIETVAEGIESREQVNYLHQTSCGMIQGFIFSTPLEIDEFELWLDDIKGKNLILPL